MKKTKEKIGISLSGGGIRATIFHLGVLARIAEEGLFEKLEHISTVSGGTLCIGLIFQNFGNKWSDSSCFLEKCLPEIYELLTTINIQNKYIGSCCLKPWSLLQARSHVISKLLKKHWGINGNVSDMPRNPRWTINATCYETGKNWRFAAKRMGDYLANYVIEPSFPLSDAIATSAAVPRLIGSLKFKTKPYQWHKFGKDSKLELTTPIAKTLTLWDGGVYDNLGVEALYKSSKGFRDGIQFMIVSDASRPLGIEKPFWLHRTPFPKSPTRLSDIPMDQVRSLRARELFKFFEKNKNGCYLRMGETVPNLYKISQIKMSNCVKEFLPAEKVKSVACFPTTLRRASTDEYKVIFRHGFETCSAVLDIIGIKEYLPFNKENYTWYN